MTDDPEVVEYLREVLKQARILRDDRVWLVRVDGALALLDGVTGLVREGDVVLTADTCDLIRRVAGVITAGEEQP